MSTIFKQEVNILNCFQKMRSELDYDECMMIYRRNLNLVEDLHPSIFLKMLQQVNNEQFVEMCSASNELRDVCSLNYFKNEIRRRGFNTFVEMEKYYEDELLIKKMSKLRI